ncbi:DUF4097 family beta strand repeat-containing protein [Streptomyces sp. NPDC002952]|uniref:DUF4097 family beta strand repeat-containing protein n=1 Tax=Streptomyces sp. NPDC002952 TaxID=3364673 RepID=UPI00367FA882
MARTARTAPARSTRTNRSAPLTRAVRGVAASAVVVGLCAGAVACGADAGDDDKPEHRSFALHGRTLTVDSDDSALELVVADSGEADQVEVTRWFKGSVVMGGEPKVTWDMKDDRLVLRMKCSGVVADCSAKHRIEVPRGIAVKVEDGDGRVTASGFAAPLGIRTSDGSVRVTDSTGPLDLHSADGSISAVGVGSRRVRATTDDGSVHLELGSVPQLVESRTEDGSITIALPRETYRVTTKSDDGAVHVSVPRDSGSTHVVSARSGDGKVTVRTAN